MDDRGQNNPSRENDLCQGPEAKHPHEFAEQRRDLCSWEGVKEECGVRGQREGMGACRDLVSWEPLQHPSQGAT